MYIKVTGVTHGNAHSDLKCPVHRQASWWSWCGERPGRYTGDLQGGSERDQPTMW